ncbi:MAG: sugar phosphate isomerase/epimerase [Synergistaceae bacterium]|jgi:sugar phosphate isomerase/epimerase|nr:sugar phosphate isomerase/epimerase [Synergistaceae bacterium]
MDRIVAVNSNCYHKYSIEDAIEGAARAGFHYIELTATKGWTEHVFPNMSFEYLCGVKSRLAAFGLEPIALSGHTNLMDPNRAHDFINNIKLAAFFGCTYIVSSIGEAHIEDKAAAADETSARHIREFVPYLDDYGLTLALETHGEHSTGRRMKSIVEMAGSGRVMINYDTANVIFFANADLESDLGDCIDSVGFMHIKDKAGSPDEWNFPALGAGYVDFPMIFRQLEAERNECPMSVEIEFGPGGSSNLEEVNEAVRASYEYLSDIGVNI